MTPDLHQALDRWAAGAPWSVAFGLTRRQYRAGQRNIILLNVARLGELDAPGLHQLCHRFESCVWPRWRHLADPPDNAGQLNRLLHRARLYGPFPDSVRQYFSILKQCPH
jgi:hypothetical protein